MIYKVFYDQNGEEDFWYVGDTFKGEQIKGEVTRISIDTSYGIVGVDIWVGMDLALTIPMHKVNRLYWMKQSED